MGEKERKVINNRLLNLQDNERLFRINAGFGWTGNVIRKTENIVMIKNPRPLHAAPKGWPDLAGFTSIEITPEMVGKKIAVFTAEEIKTTGKLSKQQKLFKNIIQKMGGIFRVIS
jgi:hypothetical protein